MQINFFFNRNTVHSSTVFTFAGKSYGTGGASKRAGGRAQSVMTREDIGMCVPEILV